MPNRPATKMGVISADVERAIALAKARRPVEGTLLVRPASGDVDQYGRKPKPTLVGTPAQIAHIRELAFPGSVSYTSGPK